MLGDIGTLAWTRRTNGLLNRSERVRYIAATVAEQARRAPALAAWRLGRDGHGEIGDDSLKLPDSKAAREALASAREAQGECLAEHALRSYIFARALGAVHGLDHDAEVLFVAAMLHDHGAVKTTGRCFTLTGAEEAERIAGQAAAEAITLHINPRVDPDQGAEAHLLHDGVLLDCVGVRAWELRREAIERVRARHPRLRFSQEGRRLLTEQGKAIPRCRAAVAMPSGFGLALRLSPWQD